MADTIDINQIATVLSQLVQNYNELAQSWFDIFYNPKAMDIEMKFFDDQGNIQYYTLPNRAKDKGYIYQGNGDPEGVVSAPTGSLYQDLENGRIYVKMATEGTEGNSVNNWKWLMALNEVYDSGPTAPDETVNRPVGSLYTDENTGWLYTMTPEGWQQVGAVGFAEKTWCEEEFNKLKKELEGGVVHIREKEEILDEKTFSAKTFFNDIVTFKKVIMGTAYRALSADIAEYYEADKDYEPGTLVQFGGDKEVTGAKDMVNAIVSTAPAYILNGGADMEHPTLLALSGRIPVRVKGKVDKFDLIKLSDEEGVAIVDNSCYNPIGRALEANPNKEEKLVECVVKLNI